MTAGSSGGMSRLAAGAAFVLCAMVAAYSLFLVFVGTTYAVCEITIPSAAAETCRTEFVRIPQAVVPLVLSALVALGLVARRIVVSILSAVVLRGFGFFTGLSIGAPIFLAALVVVLLLFVYQASRTKAPA